MNPLWSLMIVAVAHALIVNITVQDQSNLVVQRPALLNRIRCQNITDIYASPLLQVMDDALVPDNQFFHARGVTNALSDCSAVTFRFGATRVRSNSNPQSVTIVFMRDSGAGQPGDVFYQKSLPYPSNNYMWLADRAYMGLPFSNEITLQWNEVGDDGVTRFDFRSSEFLPQARPFWLGFYCTGPQEMIGGLRINAMFWATQSDVYNATPLSATLAGTVPNRQLQFRDAANLLRRGLVNWTDATQYQQQFGPIAPTGNMAWRLFFTCRVAPPTTATDAPSAAPVEVAVVVNETVAPLNTSYVTGAGGSSVTTVLVATLVPSVLLLCCAVVTGVAYVRRRHRLQKPVSPEAATPQKKTKRNDSQFDDYKQLQMQYNAPILAHDDEYEVPVNPLVRSTLHSLYNTQVNTSSDAEY